MELWDSLARKVDYLIRQLQCIKDKGCLCFGYPTALTFDTQKHELTAKFVDGSSYTVFIDAKTVERTSELVNDGYGVFPFLTKDEINYVNSIREDVDFVKIGELRVGNKLKIDKAFDILEHNTKLEYDEKQKVFSYTNEKGEIKDISLSHLYVNKAYAHSYITNDNHIIGSISISRGDGTDVMSSIDFYETVTSLTVENNTLKYKDEKGNTFSYPVLAKETLTAILYNADKNQISYIDENKEKWSFTLAKNETTTFLNYNRIHHSLEYTNEKLEKKEISLPRYSISSDIESQPHQNNLIATLALSEDMQGQIVELSTTKIYETITNIKPTEYGFKYYSEGGVVTIDYPSALREDFSTIPEEWRNTTHVLGFYGKEDRVKLYETITELRADEAHKQLLYRNEAGKTTVIKLTDLIDTGGSGSSVEITPLITEGHPIARIDNTKEIKETVTKLRVPPDSKTLYYTDEKGMLTTIKGEELVPLKIESFANPGSHKIAQINDNTIYETKTLLSKEYNHRKSGLQYSNEAGNVVFIKDYNLYSPIKVYGYVNSVEANPFLHTPYCDNIELLKGFGNPYEKDANNIKEIIDKFIENPSLYDLTWTQNLDIEWLGKTFYLYHAYLEDNEEIISNNVAARKHSSKKNVLFSDLRCVHSTTAKVLGAMRNEFTTDYNAPQLGEVFYNRQRVFESTDSGKPKLRDQILLNGVIELLYPKIYQDAIDTQIRDNPQPIEDNREVGAVVEKIPLFETLTSIQKESNGFTYIDEKGQDTRIVFPKETVTQLSYRDNCLYYKNESNIESKIVDLSIDAIYQKEVDVYQHASHLVVETNNGLRNVKHITWKEYFRQNLNPQETMKILITNGDVISEIDLIDLALYIKAITP